MVTPTTVNFGLQMGGGNVCNMAGLMGVDTSDVRKTIMFLMEGHRPTPICVPFEIFADEIHWELFANLFCSIYGACANISSKWDSTNAGPVHPTYATAYNLCEAWILHLLDRITIDPWMEELTLAMKLLPEAGFLNMDNLYWERGFELVAQKTAKNRGNVYSSILIV